ncbi:MULTISPECIES: phosphorylcholine transferase LicD [Butyricimonas]|uniref:LicD family protein n=1 Tax=Butyricimonas hominis TaxID=2763032 RepID=A0ABR7D296_9BACT|nr:MULTISPECIES: LicD family protein [Butyricimonas]MBC5622073.1 LicD family protein [Butyricimonas hominis]MCB6974824.1 LicD family protein [Butyricimonas synergistica]MCG4521566.1 LicD family protein [Butyricimonas sp. DFI.6.44]
MNNKIDVVHSVLLEMLQWFHEQCERNGLRYYVVGGTMLGTIRHQGFIPWDDDIDVGMPRKDYMEFVQKYSKEFHAPYIVEYPRGDNLDYPYVFAKIYDTRTYLVEHLRHLVKRGLYIDVFPLDGIGDTRESAYKNYQPILRNLRLHDMVTCAFRNNRKWYKNLSIILGRSISPLFVSERFLNNRINHFCEQRDFDSSEYVGNLVGNWGIKEIMHRSFFGMPKAYVFESIKVLGVEKPHEYLKTLYNDYMVLPPMERRVSHHDYVELDLKKTFLK